MLQRQKQDWNELGKLDPLWAVLSDPVRQFGRWDLDEFFRTGEELVRVTLERGAAHGLPHRHERALDFGCAVGRLTRALASRFVQCRGVDISEEMIRRARELNADLPNCSYEVNNESDLRMFPSGRFDFILSVLVLQHLPDKRSIFAFIAEFLRVLAPGGLLVFQLPSFIPFRNRLQPRRRAYQVLRGVGLAHSFLYCSLGLNPIHMNFIPRDDVLAFLGRSGGRVVFEETQVVLQKGSIRSTTYYVTK